jgi:uncharacterized membrane protein
MIRMRGFLSHWSLLPIVFLGGFLRFYQIGAKTIWLDEAFSIWLVRHSLPDLWSWLIRIDQHPLLYYSLLHFWISLFGDGQAAVRALSALCSTLTIPIFYAAIIRLSDRNTALLAALILALSPFHVRFAQEARMYALLALVAAVALYCLICILLNEGRRLHWLGLAGAQAAVMLTHNTATVFFPLALNLAIGGALLWKYLQGGVSSWPALNNLNFERQWIRWQVIAGIFWLPWAIPFIIQAVLVYKEFWLPAPTWITVWETLHNFQLAFLPGWFPLFPLWDVLYWVLAGLGVYAMRRRPARALLLLSLFFIPILGELLVSLRRPIFYERTLIWATLPYYLLVAAGLHRLGQAAGRPPKRAQRLAPVSGILLIILLSATALYSYYFHFEKEEWAQAAAYVAAEVQPDDIILFNATWVQLPFEYYFRRHETGAELRGLPVDLFDRGQLEPKMSEADVPYMHNLLANRHRVWLVYSHDWYTDPEKIIPRELDRFMRRTDERSFAGLQVIRFEAR